MAESLRNLEAKLAKLNVQGNNESLPKVLEELTLEGVVKLIKNIKASEGSQ